MSGLGSKSRSLAIYAPLPSQAGRQWRAVALIAISAVAYEFAAYQFAPDFTFFPSVALAQHDGGGQGGGGSGGGGHDDGSHDDGGHDDGGGDDGGHDEGGGHGGSHGGGSIWVPPGGQHQGNGSGSIAHPRNEYGGRYGRDDLEESVFRRHGQGEADLAGRPTWAGGAVPEDIELGRLNMARAPESVRLRALEEVYRSLLDKDGDGVVDPDADIRAVESPMGNLAMYIQAVAEDRWQQQDAAWFLGRAAEKNLPIGVQTIYALHTILSLEDPAIVFSGFEYDRATSYDAETITKVFGGAAAADFGVSGFALAADDVRMVEQFTHDHAGTELVN